MLRFSSAARVRPGTAKGPLVLALALGALAAVVGVWWVSTAGGDPRAEAEAKQKLSEWGAIALRGADQKHVETLTLTLSKAPDRIADAMEQVAKLTYLSHLDVSNQAVTDDLLRHLAPLKRLQSINLNHTQVTDAGLQHLQGLPLETLQLANVALTPAALKQIATITSVRTLNLSGNELAGGWGALAAMPNLEWLTVNDVPVEPAAVDAWCQIPKLARLSLLNSNLSEALQQKIKSAKPGIHLELAAQALPDAITTPSSGGDAAP